MTRMQALLRSTPCNLARRAVQDALIVPALRTYCAPYRVRRAAQLQTNQPFIIVANHASHLDTPAILAALPSSIRHRTAVAAAEDYFFTRPLLGLAVSLGIGAFPFPRKGIAGLERAAELLKAGWNVLLFPEGTRSVDGLPHAFHTGVARLATTTGVDILPV